MYIFVVVDIFRGYLYSNFVIWGGISSDIRSEILFYGDVHFNIYISKPGICFKNISCMSDVYSLR